MPKNEGSSVLVGITMKILVYGVGGIGGFIGSFLCKTKFVTTFLSRGKTFLNLKKNGLKLESLLGNQESRNIQITDNLDDFNEFDIIILSVKLYDLKTCLLNIKKGINRNTIILPFQNGIIAEQLIDEIFGDKCESKYIQPTFIIDYPKEMSPLTKEHRTNPELTERFELLINGSEIANSYSELNDPIDQLNRFEDQLKLSEKGDEEAMFIDHDFVKSLEYGMPPTSGIGIGIDRLVMLLTNNRSIQEVLFLPQMKPLKKQPELSEDAKSVFEILKEFERIDLSILKEKSQLSNKKWDKSIKELTSKSIAKVVKDSNGKLEVFLN